ncbi:hypothetical protein [Dankookia sp. P2]|uniref:hypothetical protein n=1 Tax=Dankookia sp. P2 TaxID=3423955 RepID=UPI003D6767F4
MSTSGQGGAAAAVLPPGWRLELHAALPSTSALLARRAEAGEPEGLAIQALEQTAGRGRGGPRLGLAARQSLSLRPAAAHGPGA